MKVCFNGWFSGFIEKTNPGITVDFFLQLFEKVYHEKCEIGLLQDSKILCEFDMLIGSPSVVNIKTWLHTYLFSGEFTFNKKNIEKEALKFTLGDTQKANNLLNWKAETSLEKGINILIKNIR